MELDEQEDATLALGVLVGLVVVVFLFATVIPLYNRRADDIAKLSPPGAWAHTCVDPTAPRAWRAVIVDDIGLRIVGSRGRPVHAWPWTQITSASLGPVMPAGAVIEHKGLVLHLTTGTNVGLLLPSRSTLSYPSEILSEALTQVHARHRSGG